MQVSYKHSMLAPTVPHPPRQERMESIRREQEEAAVRECSFRPAINPRSARMVEQRQRILRVSRRAGRAVWAGWAGDACWQKLKALLPADA